MKPEPDRLRSGRRYHKKVQDEWEDSAEGTVQSEKPITKPSGGAGRIDIHVTPDGETVAVVEIKASDWDRMTNSGVRRNVRRQIRQIWDYIHSQLADGKDVCPGVVFPARPSSEERMKLIEEMFLAEWIPVVWEDETIEERKQRE
jgi:hypothetical protein